MLLITGGVYGAVLVDRWGTDDGGDLATFAPTAAVPDPSLVLPAIETRDYRGGAHISAEERVAYTRSPPFGGSHDRVWAPCDGMVYESPVRSETLVHSLEHGAVWIAYDPARISGEDLGRLADRVEGVPFTLLAPYPGLDAPVSLQSWGHQLKLNNPMDPRIDQFLTALRDNPYTHPEGGGTCTPPGAALFDENDPPPFVPAPQPAVADATGIRAETHPESRVEADGVVTPRTVGG